MQNREAYRAGRLLDTRKGKITLTDLRKLLKGSDVKTAAAELGLSIDEVNKALYERWRFKTFSADTKKVSIEEEQWLRTIYWFNKKHGYAASPEELADLRECSVEVAISIANHLKSKGLVDWIPGESRTLHVTPRGHRRALNHKLFK